MIGDEMKSKIGELSRSERNLLDLLNSGKKFRKSNSYTPNWNTEDSANRLEDRVSKQGWVE
jgi:hypothetical protein